MALALTIASSLSTITATSVVGLSRRAVAAGESES
jgi:hypothetical protein